MPIMTIFRNFKKPQTDSLPPPVPHWRRYDCAFCDGAAELQAALREINTDGHVVVAVTQHEFTYTIIFKRFD